MDKRLRSNIKLDIRQEGFVPVDGCFENVKILPQLIKHQRLKKKEYNIVFTDLAKASDTVSHKSIAKGLRCKGVPEQLISAILEMYFNSNTSITVRGKTTRRISINAGVKQGCPLSLLLFNLILDELIEKLKGLGIGIKINDQLISVMAFADDLVLVTEHSSHMIECQKFLYLKGLCW